MSNDSWETVHRFSADRPFEMSYPWFFICDIVGDWTCLRLTATGIWDCLGPAVKPCGPDGHVDLMLQQDRLLVPACAPGMLIGKLGGSTAGRGDGTIFVIGSKCVLSIPEKKSTVLFVGVNGAIPSSLNRIDMLTLEISGAVDE
jgi:hypothetical protein